MRLRSRIALTLAALGVLVAIVRACLRPAAHPESQQQPAVCAPALSPRVVLVVIDAVRADTFFGDAFASFRDAHPAAASGLVRTSPVTMSTAGVRSMATGTFPDLFDVLHNWDNVESTLPGVPDLARDAGRQTMIFGDSIWHELFPKGFVVADTEVHVPRIIYYLRAETLMDDVLVGHLTERLKSQSQPPPDFLVLHLVGLDHAGHRRGVKSAGYADVARRIVKHMENVIGLLPADSTVLVTADHGATESGGHGGGSDAETTVPLFAFGTGIAPGARLNINQVDLAPTLSCLLGLPIPATSLGRPAVELFDEPAPARLRRLRVGLSQVEQAWAAPTGAPKGGPIAAGAGEQRAIDGRFSTIFEAFRRNVARTRAPVAFWGLVLLIFLIARIGDLRISRSGSAAVAALLGAGIILTGVASRSSLLALCLSLGVALAVCAQAEWKRTRFASRVHLLWLAGAAAAVILAMARDRQGRSTTLLFGSPSDAWLATGGAILCLALRALERRLRAATADRRSYLLLPIIFVVVIEGGDPAIPIGNGFFAAWLVWDAVAGWRTRQPGQALRVTGALAQGGLLALYLSPPRYQGWIRSDAFSTAAGAVAVLAALWFLRPRPMSSRRSLSLLVAPIFVLAIALLRKGPLGETAVQIGLALSLTSFVGFAIIAWRRGDSPAARWGMACALVTLWWLLCAPSQKIALGFAAVALVAFARTAGRARPAVAVALVGLALAFWRWGLIGYFEGEFGFGSLEISLAYVGNPGRHVPQGALTIVLKGLLPLAFAAAVLANDEDAGVARPVLQATAFVLGARIVHLAIATAVNPDSFYTMYRILGELTHEIVFLFGIGLFSFVTAPRSSEAPAVSGGSSGRRPLPSW